MFDGLIDVRQPPTKRVGFCGGADVEHHLTEGAVMVAFAMYLLRMAPGLKHVAIHPDGEHGKRFDFLTWLAAQGFTRTKASGNTAYGGVYLDVAGRSFVVNPKSGRGDVVADFEGRSYIAECKGGVINTSHPGQKSRLRKGLCEAVGQLMSKPLQAGQRQFAVVPLHEETRRLSEHMAKRAAAANIEIVLVSARGNVLSVD